MISVAKGQLRANDKGQDLYLVFYPEDTEGSMDVIAESWLITHTGVIA